MLSLLVAGHTGPGGELAHGGTGVGEDCRSVGVRFEREPWLLPRLSRLADAWTPGLDGIGAGRRHPERHGTFTRVLEPMLKHAGLEIHTDGSATTKHLRLLLCPALVTSNLSANLARPYSA